MSTNSNPTPPELNARHFEILKNAPIPPDWIGHGPRIFARQIGALEEVVRRMPERPFDRATLADFVAAAANHDAETKFVAVMSWGKMRRNNARKALAVKRRWIGLIDGLAETHLTRANAYARFIQTRALPDTHLAGLGVAYFTKLLFFLRPVRDAYIMDKWTGKSINLLFLGENTVKFDNDVVSNRNTERNYQQFCERIEFLAKKLAVKPEEAERRIFSNGGRNAGQWRAHVRRQVQQ